MHSRSRSRAGSHAGLLEPSAAWRGILRVYRGLGEVDEGEAPWPCDERDAELSHVRFRELRPPSSSAQPSEFPLPGGVAVRLVARGRLQHSQLGTRLGLEGIGDGLSSFEEQDEDVGKDDGDLWEAAGSEAGNVKRHLPGSLTEGPLREGRDAVRGLCNGVGGTTLIVEVDCWGKWASEAIMAAGKAAGSLQTVHELEGCGDSLVTSLSTQLDLSGLARRLVAASCLQAKSEALGLAGRHREAMCLLERALELIVLPSGMITHGCMSQGRFPHRLKSELFIHRPQ